MSVKFLISHEIRDLFTQKLHFQGVRKRPDTIPQPQKIM